MGIVAMGVSKAIDNTFVRTVRTFLERRVRHSLGLTQRYFRVRKSHVEDYVATMSE